MFNKDTYYVKKLKTLMLYTFNMAAKLEELALRETSTNNDLSVTEAHALVAIGRKQPKTMSTIAGELLINVSTLSIAINKLEKKGFVERLRESDDRRIVRIALTKKGVESLARHEKFYYDLIDEMIKDMDDDEKKVYMKSMEHMSEYVEKKLNSYEES